MKLVTYLQNTLDFLNRPTVGFCRGMEVETIDNTATKKEIADNPALKCNVCLLGAFNCANINYYGVVPEELYDISKKVLGYSRGFSTYNDSVLVDKQGQIDLVTKMLAVAKEQANV